MINQNFSLSFGYWQAICYYYFHDPFNHTNEDPFYEAHGVVTDHCVTVRFSKDGEGMPAQQSNRNQRRRNMKKFIISVVVLALLTVGGLSGCSGTKKSPDVADNIRQSLDQAGFKDVTVSQDRDKGIVTLSGQVARDNDKLQAETLAKSLAGAQVVANQIVVLPIGMEKDAKTVNSDLDQGIESNLNAALIQNKMHDDVKYKVKSGVVTLTGEVNSQNKRDQAEQVAAKVPNVQQVVNDLQVKDQKASSLQ
jgi:hyperosmotically inducible protein